MSYEIKLFIRDMEKINRTILFNDNIPLQLLVKSLILSMHGITTDLFLIAKDGEYESLGFDDTESLALLNLKVGKKYCIEYNYDGIPWDLEFVVLKKNKDLNPKEIEVIDGFGYGICREYYMHFIRDLLNDENEVWKERILKNYKSLNTYLNFDFSLEENNALIDEYIALYKEVHSPKSIVMNVSLNGFDKVIKRKIIVNNNISIDKFCRAIIASMHGDMEHLYTIGIDKIMYDESILDEKLNYLELTVGKKFKVIYDFGDNWKFNIKVSKIIDGYQAKELDIIDGIGYGIVEDCGGIYGLNKVFNGESDYFDSQDINDFNLEEIQKYVEKELKIEWRNIGDY